MSDENVKEALYTANLFVGKGPKGGEEDEDAEEKNCSRQMNVPSHS
jgi:hypothetical protein